MKIQTKILTNKFVTLNICAEDLKYDVFSVHPAFSI